MQGPDVGNSTLSFAVLLVFGNGIGGGWEVLEFLIRP